MAQNETTSGDDHQAHGRCISCGYPVHRYAFGWQHVGCGMFECSTIAPLPTCCEDHRECPDGGRCHHACPTATCFRVDHCGPLSGVFADNRWPRIHARQG
jgi:hypothetical protein